MEFVHEVTAYLENKPGRLAKICSALAQEKVDILALSVMEREGPSVLRCVTSDLEKTKNSLTALGIEFRICDVVAVQLENRTGSLARVLERLAEEHINVEYAYASTTSAPGKALGIFHTSNPKRASQILSDATGTSAGAASSRPSGRRPLHSR
ncbi:MAG: ACT domain-containing protein [Isosphaeraceae bacterium]